METKKIVKIVGIVIAVVAVVLAFKFHPWHMAAIVVGVGTYFVGDKFIK